MVVLWLFYVNKLRSPFNSFLVYKLKKKDWNRVRINAWEKKTFPRFMKINKRKKRLVLWKLIFRIIFLFKLIFTDFKFSLIMLSKLIYTNFSVGNIWNTLWLNTSRNSFCRPISASFSFFRKPLKVSLLTEAIPRRGVSHSVAVTEICSSK